MSANLSVAPTTMPRVGTVDDRFQSCNVEMLEVTGGRFWKPYKDIAKTAGQAGSEAKGGDAPAGMSPDLYQYRPPIDLANRRLRAMAGALGPAYVRISGTWANTTYFADMDTPPKDPPQGYGGVLTRQQWLGAIAFSRAVDAPIVTSVPIGAGTRGADQVWRPDQTRRWLAFTKAHGGTIAAAEYFNEPTLATMGGAPKGYDAAAFGRDFRVFDTFMRKEYAGTKLLAPDSVGEANADWGVRARPCKSTGLDDGSGFRHRETKCARISRAAWRRHESRPSRGFYPLEHDVLADSIVRTNTALGIETSLMRSAHP